MDWREHIHSDPGILGGKPVFRGTRLSVEMILKLIAAGWSYEKMADEYPGIEREFPRAAAAFAAELIHEDDFFAIGRAKAA